MKKVMEVFMIGLIFWSPGAWANFEDLYCKGSPSNTNITDMIGEGFFYWRDELPCIKVKECRLEALGVALEASMNKCEEVGGLPVCFYTKNSLEITSGANVRARVKIQCRFR